MKVFFFFDHSFGSFDRIIGIAGLWHSLLLVILCCLCTFLTGISLSAIATNGAMKVSFCCTSFAYCMLCLQLVDCWVKFLTTYGWINLLFFPVFLQGGWVTSFCLFADMLSDLRSLYRHWICGQWLSWDDCSPGQRLKQEAILLSLHLNCDKWVWGCITVFALQGGGPYYLIGRALGPEVGVSIGLCFFLGNAVAGSL